jgi:hypothetical protein
LEAGNASVRRSKPPRRGEETHPFEAMVGIEGKMVVLKVPGRL